MPFLALVVASLALFGAGCAPASRSEAADVILPPTRVARSFEPTKFARRVPTDTPIPTSTATPSPTAPPTATDAPTITPTRVVTRRPTRTATLSSQPAMAALAAPSATTTPALSGATTCAAIPDENYGSLGINGPATDRPAAIHPDLNLGIRGYSPVVAYTGLVDLGGDTAPEAPQLAGLFTDRRLPASRGVYQVYDWDWSTNKRASPITDPPVTLVGVSVSLGETIHVPDADTNIGLGYAALILYAAPTRITIQYTAEDSVERGYTLQLENLCVEPRLLSLYRDLDANGRGQLPAVRAGQAIGRAATDQLGIVIRDSGTFLDPRSRKDWWRGH